MQNRLTKPIAYVLQTNEWVTLLWISWIACAGYAWVWRDFLNSSLLFGDYGLSIPALLDSFFWAHRNGLAVQWFTPGFCGGVPVFPDPQSGQYSILMLLTYWLGPTFGAKSSFVVHAWIGFVGAYVLCRKSFKLRIDSSLVAATLFMFNGFYAYRILVSHLFFGLMLTPALAWLLIEACMPRRWWKALAYAIAAALLFAVYVYSGGLGMAIPFCAGVTILVALQFVSREETPPVLSIARGAGIFVVIAYAICAPKLVAAGAFLGHFPREGYRLPGFPSWLALIVSMWKILFFSPGDTGASIAAQLANAQWLLERHEWEFGVTLAPLILLLVPLKNFASIAWPKRGFKWLLWAVVAILLLLPLALNYYSPEWNQWIKQVPVLKSSSNLIRYFWIWVVFLCFFPVIFFEKYNGLSVAWRTAALGLCIALVVFTFETQNKDYYRRGSTYDPTSVEQAFQSVKGGLKEPRIDSLGVLRDDQGKIVGPIDRNKTLAEGMSQLWCYQPIFGYRLEQFPFGSIHPGDPLGQSAPGKLNFKNPACMVYPEVNACGLGDEFSLAQRNSLVQFLNYDSYPFELSAQQRTANALALWGFILILVYFGCLSILWIVKRGSKYI